MNTQMTDKELEALRMLGAYLPYCECGLRAKGALEIYLDVWRISDREIFDMRFRDKEADENAQRDVDPSALLTDFEGYEANSKGVESDLKGSLEVLIKGVKELGELQARQIDEYEHTLRLKLEAFQSLLEGALDFLKKTQTSLGFDEHQSCLIEAECLLYKSKNMVTFLTFLLEAKAEHAVLSCQVAMAQECAYLAYEYLARLIPASLFPRRITILPVFPSLSPEYSKIISEIKKSQSRIEASLQILSDFIQKFTKIQRVSKYQAEAKAVEVIKILEDFKESANQKQASQAQSVSALKAVSAWLVSLLEIPSEKIKSNPKDSYLERFLATREKVHEGFRQFDETINHKE